VNLRRGSRCELRRFFFLVQYFGFWPVSARLALISASRVQKVAFKASATSYSRVSLLKTVNYQESLGIFRCDRRTVGRHDHHSMCSRLRALVPVSQPSVAGTRACRPETSADRLAAATPSPPPASFRRSAPVGVPLPSVAAGPRRLGTRQTGDSGQMASPRLSDLLAVAITLSRTPQDKRRNPGPDPSDESPIRSGAPLASTAKCSSSASR
jgi:hypothetical protein